MLVAVYYHLQTQHGNTPSLICRVSVHSVWALTFESLDLETSFSVYSRGPLSLHALTSNTHEALTCHLAQVAK